MRILFLHVDYLEYEVKEKAVKGLPDLPKEARHGRAEEALVCFISAEKRDEANPIGAAKAAAASIEDVPTPTSAPPSLRRIGLRNSSPPSRKTSVPAGMT